MKILALSDKVMPYIYTPSTRERYADVDLIVGCGDLPASYLEFVVSQLDVPLVYVPGNHDPDDYHVPGGINIDGKVVLIAGVLIAGLGGSRRYKPRGRHQYSSLEMRLRSLRLISRVFRHQILHQRSLDIFVTHAPPYGVHDQCDVPHTGFEVFHDIMRVARPALMLHGHVHVPRNIVAKETVQHGCRILNVYPSKVVDYARIGYRI